MNSQTMKRVAQFNFGCILVFFGLNHLLHFFPIPEKEGFAHLFLETLDHSLYLMPMVTAVQILVGVSLMTNRYTSLALLAFLPISVNIFMFHFIHDFGTIAPALAIFGMNIVQIYWRLDSYKPLISVT